MEPNNNQTTTPPIEQLQPMSAVQTPSQQSQPAESIPMAEKKPSKMPLLILAVIVLAIVVLGGGIFMMNQSSSPSNNNQATSLQAVPSPTQSQAETAVEDVTIQDVNGDVTELEGSLKNL